MKVYKKEKDPQKFIPFVISIEVESIEDQIDLNGFLTLEELTFYEDNPKRLKFYEDLSGEKLPRADAIRARITASLEEAIGQFSKHQSSEIVESFFLVAKQQNAFLRRMLRQQSDAVHHAMVQLEEDPDYSPPFSIGPIEFPAGSGKAKSATSCSSSTEPPVSSSSACGRPRRSGPA